MGKALAQGDGYVSIVSPEKPPARHFPPGYPAVLAVLMSVFSEKIATLQAANGFFLIGAVLMLFDIFRRMGRNLHLAFVAALLVLVNVNILMFATQLMSETVYLFFSTLALWCFTRSDLNRRPWADGWFWAFVLMAVVSYYIRQTGLMLLAGVGLYLLFRRKWLHIGLMAAAFVVGVLPWSLRNARLGGDSHLRDMQMINPLQPGLGQVQGVGGWVSRFFTNTERYLTREVPSGVLSTFVEDYTRPIGGGEWLTGLLLVALMAFGWWRLRQYRLLLAGYAAATFALLLIYPEVWTGNRLMLHLVPFFIFCGLYGLYQLLKRGCLLYTSPSPRD